MAYLALLLLLPSIVFGGGSRTKSSYYTPCDCFDVTLSYGYPRTIYGEVCYKYRVTKKRSSSQCRADLDYFVIDSYVAMYILLHINPYSYTYTYPFSVGWINRQHLHGIHFIVTSIVKYMNNEYRRSLHLISFHFPF